MRVSRHGTVGQVQNALLRVVSYFICNSTVQAISTGSFINHSVIYEMVQKEIRWGIIVQFITVVAYQASDQ